MLIFYFNKYFSFIWYRFMRLILGNYISENIEKVLVRGLWKKDLINKNIFFNIEVDIFCFYKMIKIKFFIEICVNIKNNLVK